MPTGGALHCDEGRHHLGHGAASAVDATLRERRWPGRRAQPAGAWLLGDAWERGVLHDARIRPPWRRAHAALVGLSDLVLWLHSFAAVRAVVPDFSCRTSSQLNLATTSYSRLIYPPHRSPRGAPQLLAAAAEGALPPRRGPQRPRQRARAAAHVEQRALRRHQRAPSAPRAAARRRRRRGSRRRATPTHRPAA